MKSAWHSPLVARSAAFDGWSKAAVEMAGSQAGVAPAIADLAFEGGATSMIEAWFASIDFAMLTACPPERVRRHEGA